MKLTESNTSIDVPHRCGEYDGTVPKAEDQEFEFADDDEQTCPVCGQPVDHKYEERSSIKYELRADAVACKGAEIAGQRMVYVHVR